MHEINGTGRSHNPAEASNGARVAISSQGTHGRTNIRPAESEREALTPSTTTPLPNNLAGLHRPTPAVRHVVRNRTRAIRSAPLPAPREVCTWTSINKPAKCKADRRRWAQPESTDERCSGTGGIMKACLLPCLLLASTGRRRGKRIDRRRDRVGIYLQTRCHDLRPHCSSIGSGDRPNDTSGNLRNDYNSTITLIILAYSRPRRRARWSEERSSGYLSHFRCPLYISLDSHPRGSQITHGDLVLGSDATVVNRCDGEASASRGVVGSSGRTENRPRESEWERERETKRYTE